MTQTSTKMAMDQFMNDFLDGAYLEDGLKLDDPSNATTRRSKGRRKSGGGDALPPPTTLRRNKTSGDTAAAPVRRSVRRTKSTTDEGGRIREPRRGVRRTKSGEGKPKHRSSGSSRSSRRKQLDPAEVLRMLEMHADRGNDEIAALMMTRMKEDALLVGPRRKSGIPGRVEVQQKGPQAA